MKISHLVLFSLLFAASTGLAAGQAKTPDALVAELYKLHDANKDPFSNTKDRLCSISILPRRSPT